MKVMIVGDRGMLGREVENAVARMGHSPMIEDVDITKEILVKDCCPDVVINCAGLVPQRDPPPTAAEMMRVNGYGPWNLADWCDQIEARLIHVSTDCVFDGSGGGPHSEGDYSRPISNYGKSKLAGEVRWEPHLTVRTSFVGLGERGLIAELKECIENSEPYNASDKLLWTGHTARFVAEALVILAEKAIHGLLHIPGETLTRHELVHLLKETLNLDIYFGRHIEPEIDRRLASTRWAKEDLPDLPPFKWQLEWLRRSR